MNSYLKLSINRQDDRSGELLVEFETNGFCGKGSAYFDLKFLEEKAVEFAQYPLTSDGSACIEGGYWTSDDPQKLSQELIHISAFPVNSTGEIGLQVRVCEPYYGVENKPYIRYSSSVEFKTSYEEMRIFSKRLIHLARGDIPSFLFEESKPA
ncbi:MAG: hypothetical protein AB1403_26225 [Candidatus Riflebacteria bacterium]